MPHMTTWRLYLAAAMEYNGDSGPVLAYAPNEDVFDVEFDAGYGRENGPEFLAWTASFVYFPVSYDGAESIGSAPRNPQSEGQRHIGE